MIQDIRENSTFLRYYEIWRTNPSSVVFAPLAEMLILHKCYEEAITVCKRGLEKNPELISGRIALARAYIGVANYKRSKEEAAIVLNKYPDHPEATELFKISEKNLVNGVKASEPILRPKTKSDEMFLPSKLDPAKDDRWKTVTMAEIFASQGNILMAREIYKDVLEREPDNVKAREGLSKLVDVEPSIGS